MAIQPLIPDELDAEEARIQAYEDKGMTRSDAQGVVMAEVELGGTGILPAAPTAPTTAPAHTPGPWNYDNACNPDFRLFVYSESDSDRDDTSVCGITDGPKAEANARLIAAAPELLASLKELVDSLNELGRFTEDKRVNAAFDTAYSLIEQAEARA